MNIWRMKLRAGSHGDSMWPACRERGIAAITYRAIYDTDLSRMTKLDLDPRVKGAGRSSMYRFAWEMKGGDEILVGDSISKQVIGRGYISSAPGERAYRYNARNPIREPQDPNVPWRHEVPVVWDKEFEPIAYRDGAPQNSVMHFNPGWRVESDGERPASSHDKEGEAGDFLNESAYMRETLASRRNVERLHAGLSNRFRAWLNREFSVHAKQEQNCVDLTFEHDGMSHLAELKICYGGRTRFAIREAIGQLLEYNHYPPRSEAESWWLVMDQAPEKPDRVYIDALRQRYALPLRLAWPMNATFESHPKWTPR